MNNKGFAHILILIIVILGVGVLGYYSWKGGYIKFDATPTNSTNFQTDQKTDHDQISDWKTYTNGEISLQHPQSYSINFETNSFKQGDLFSIEAPSPIHKTGSAEKVTTVSILSVATPTRTDLSLNEWFEESTYGAKDPEFSKFDITRNTRFGGLKTIQKYFCGTLGCWTYLFTKYDSSIYILLYPSPENYKDIFKTREEVLELQYNMDQIISTLKFLDSINDQANWQQYKDDTFSFKYPPQWKIPQPDKQSGEIIRIDSQNGNISIRITKQNIEYGFALQDIEEKPLHFTFLGKNISAIEKTVENRSVFVDQKVTANNQEFYILFGTGYPVNEDVKSSMQEYFSQKDTVLKILSSFKLVN